MCIGHTQIVSIGIIDLSESPHHVETDCTSPTHAVCKTAVMMSVACARFAQGCTQFRFAKIMHTACTHSDCMISPSCSHPGCTQFKFAQYKIMRTSFMQARLIRAISPKQSASAIPPSPPATRKTAGQPISQPTSQRNNHTQVPDKPISQPRPAN